MTDGRLAYGFLWVFMGACLVFGLGALFTHQVSFAILTAGAGFALLVYIWFVTFFWDKL